MHKCAKICSSPTSITPLHTYETKNMDICMQTEIQNMQSSTLYADLQNMQKYEVPTLLVMSH